MFRETPCSWVLKRNASSMMVGADTKEDFDRQTDNNDVQVDVMVCVFTSCVDDEITLR